jgi:hypothetical protein
MKSQKNWGAERTFVNHLSWEDGKSQSKHSPWKDGERTQVQKKAFCSNDAVAVSGSPGNTETICTSTLKPDGQADPGVDESSIYTPLFIHNQGLLSAQVNEPWCNRRRAATSETKHKPRLLPEYSTKGIGSYHMHVQVSMSCVLSFPYLCKCLGPLVFRTAFCPMCLCWSVSCVYKKKNSLSKISGMFQMI